MPDTRVTVRFPEELLEQIDETATELAKTQKIFIKRSGMIKILLERALSELYPYKGRSGGPDSGKWERMGDAK